VVVEAVEPEERREHVARLRVEAGALAGDRRDRRLEDVEQMEIAAGTDLIEPAAIGFVERTDGRKTGQRFGEKAPSHVQGARHDV
jgi:hypothetical protein